MKAGKRLRLIAEIYALCIESFESFERDRIGSDLAYLLGAISAGDVVDYRDNGEIQHPYALLALFLERLPGAHPVWGFIRRPKRIDHE
ncbi:MAG: hypothetical protein JKY94_16865 [Rhodobacteraceae bacterium]|nr:hypothetical protein [Paracoccaceae bacterium]